MKLPEIKQRIIKNSNLWRIIRIVLSIVFITQGILKTDYILLAAGVFLLIHAVLNLCLSCATGSCEIPKNKSNEII